MQRPRSDWPNLESSYNREGINSDVGIAAETEAPPGEPKGITGYVMGAIVDGTVRPASFDPFGGWVCDTRVGLGQGSGCAVRDEHRTRFLSYCLTAGFIQVLFLQPIADRLRCFSYFAFAIELAVFGLLLLPARAFGFRPADNLVGAERAIASRGEVDGRRPKRQEKMTEERLAASELPGDATDGDTGTVEAG